MKHRLISVPVQGVKIFEVHNEDVWQELQEEAKKGNLNINSLAGYDFEDVIDVNEDIAIIPNTKPLITEMWLEGSMANDRENVYQGQHQPIKLYMLSDCDGNNYATVQVFGDVELAGDIWQESFQEDADYNDFDHELIGEYVNKLAEHGIAISLPSIEWI